MSLCYEDRGRREKASENERQRKLRFTACTIYKDQVKSSWRTALVMSTALQAHLSLNY